jgi:hypothetical protein
VFYQAFRNGGLDEMNYTGGEIYAYKETGGSNLDMEDECYDVNGKRLSLDKDIYSQYQLILVVSTFSATAPPILKRKELKRHANLKAQCFYRMAERMEEGGYYLQALQGTKYQDRVTDELKQLRQGKPDEDSKLQLESKKDTKRRLGGKSYDFADMIAMREFCELAGSRGAKFV